MLNYIRSHILNNQTSIDDVIKVIDNYIQFAKDTVDGRLVTRVECVDENEDKKGDWIVVMEGNACRLKCSKCGQVFIFNSDTRKFCGNCGSEMHEEVIPLENEHR